MKTHIIYIIPGILGNKFEYIRMRNRLRKEAYPSVVFKYKSRKVRVLEASNQLYKSIKQDSPDEISFITHSLGGLVLRGLILHIQKDEHFPKINKIVMIAPPNQGTISGNFMNKYALFRFVFGVNLRDVKNDENSLAKTLPVNFKTDVGIIAGISGKKSGYNPFIGEDNDGEIRPEETKLGTETDFITVKANHLSILHKKETFQYVISFLNSGKFLH